MLKVASFTNNSFIAGCYGEKVYSLNHYIAYGGTNTIAEVLFQGYNKYHSNQKVF